MEQQSVVHGQLDHSEDALLDSDNDSVNSRLSFEDQCATETPINAHENTTDEQNNVDDNCEIIITDFDENCINETDQTVVTLDFDDVDASLDKLAQTTVSTDDEFTAPYSCNTITDLITDNQGTRTVLIDNENDTRDNNCAETNKSVEAYVPVYVPVNSEEPVESGLELDNDCDVISASRSKADEENCFRNVLTDIPDICNVNPDSAVISPPSPECDITDIHLVDTHLDRRRDDGSDHEVHVESDVRPGSVGHLLQLVRALANTLPSGSAVDTAAIGTSASGLINLGYEDNETEARSSDQESDESSNEDIDWSWLADEAQLCAATSRPSSWLRASMRRVRRFALGEPSTVQTTIVPARHSAPAPSTEPTSRSQPCPHIPDIVNSVSRVAVAVSASCVRNSAPPLLSTEGLPSTPVRDPLPLPSAPPESPVIPPRSPDDFPRRYSLLGRIDQGGGTAGQQPEEPQELPSEPTTEDESSSECEDAEEKENCWPHSLSSLLASLGCTLGLFNVSRFAILSVHFGANFVVQFLLLSAMVGWPLYAFNASLGQHLKAGVVDMWVISPLFQGIGVALLLAQAMLGLYSVVGVAWLFTYFRDSFINKFDSYRWAENGTRIEDSVSNYLNFDVLQRQGSSAVGHLKFQVTFNLAVVWMIVFVCLSKGIKSYGKSVYLFGTLPLMCIAMLTIKMLSITGVWFDQTAWGELFVNANCWSAAAVECFTTWGLLGAATMQMRSHSATCRLPREVLAVGAITVATLVSAALLANGFSQILRANDLRYIPSSFEQNAVFLSSIDVPRQSSTPVRWMAHGHFIVGLQVTLSGMPTDSVSGYQVAQFATELAPSVFAKLGPQTISPFWTVIFYFTLIMLGISQQLCIWHCVITGVMAINIERLRSWETTITFLSCACGFVLGLPMTTELGVSVVYFMDYCVGGAWWLILLQVAHIVAALMAQGGEQVAQTLLGNRRPWLQAIVVFSWNVVLPISLTVVSIAWFKTNNYRDLFSSRYHGYWPAWARRVGCLVQLVPLILVPLVSAIQTWRYLTNGPPDLFDRLRLLCRPGSSALSVSSMTAAASAPSQALPELSPFDDPPPKYTPPPSYATATGARIAKLLRRSFRRLVGPSAPSPPDYSAVLVEMGGPQTVGRSSTLSAMEVAHILRSSMRRTLRRDQTRSAPSTAQESSKAAPVI